MWTCHAIGDRCWSWRCADTISEETSDRILSVYRELKRASIPGVVDVVPAYTELAVHFDPQRVDSEHLRNDVHQRLIEVTTQSPEHSPFTTHCIPVVYEGPDLERVAAHTGFSIEEVIQRHSAVSYKVAMVGFQPHFPYCLGLDPALVTPRLSSPRDRVPAGSVAVAAWQTGVYPNASPGGWNLLGLSDPGLLKSILPGDVLRFEPVEALE